MRLLSLCALILVCSPALLAEDPASFGVGVNALIASGNSKPLLGKGVGVDAGVYFDVGTTEQGRFRVSYGKFDHGTMVDINGQPENGEASTISVGLDFLLPFGARDAKGYALLGFGFSHGSFQYTQYGYLASSTTPVSATRESDSEAGVCLAAGVGFRFTPHLGAELRYEKANYAAETRFLAGQQPLDVGSDHFSIGLQARF
jgi:hypothetical protein